MPFFQKIGRDFLDLPQTPGHRIEPLPQMALFRDFNTSQRVCRALKNLNADTISPFVTALSADYADMRWREAFVLQLSQWPAEDDCFEFLCNNSHGKDAHVFRVLGEARQYRCDTLSDTRIEGRGQHRFKRPRGSGRCRCSGFIGGVENDNGEPIPSLTQTSSFRMLMQAG